MNEEQIIERLFAALAAGQRSEAKGIVAEAAAGGMSGEAIAHQVLWPVLDMISKLYRADQLSTLAHHYATRLLRVLVDQVQMSYEQRPSREKTILMFCGHGDTDDLAGQLTADLVEADGYRVFLSGGGICNDDILEELGRHRPEVLLMFSSSPSDAPNIRRLIDTINDGRMYPGMQFVVGGGVFNRAEGLAEEIGADLWASSPGELLEKLVEEGDRRATPDQRTVGRHRRPTPAAKVA